MANESYLTARQDEALMMRHYFADGLLAFTGNLALVQEALGRQDPKTTRGYTKIKVEEIAASVQAMS